MLTKANAAGKPTSFPYREAGHELQALNVCEVEEALVRTMADGGKRLGSNALEPRDARYPSSMAHSSMVWSSPEKLTPTL